MTFMLQDHVQLSIRIMIGGGFNIDVINSIYSSFILSTTFFVRTSFMVYHCLVIICVFMPLWQIEDFLAKADEEPVSKCLAKSGEVLCEHKDKGAEHFSHGLCEECYDNVTHIYYVCNALILIFQSLLLTWLDCSVHWTVRWTGGWCWPSSFPASWKTKAGCC